MDKNFYEQWMDAELVIAKHGENPTRFLIWKKERDSAGKVSAFTVSTSGSGGPRDYCLTDPKWLEAFEQDVIDGVFDYAGPG